jgi:predicted esterase
MHLYDKCLPTGVIWFVLRSAEDLPDMWWRPYLEGFLSEIINSFTIMGMINPNKVFLTGFSAGGDGVYHMGPRMADLLAGAAMMAGHPNNVEMYNVRNITFAIHVGENDSAYNRNNLGK